MLKPTAAMSPKVPSSTTAPRIAGISVGPPVCRKRNITRTTSTIPSRSVFTTSWIEIFMKGVTSLGYTTTSKPGGK